LDAFADRGQMSREVREVPPANLCVAAGPLGKFEEAALRAWTILTGKLGSSLPAI
jgi:hypothetical protein